MPWGAAAAAVVGGVMSSSASRSASRQQQQAADQATQLQRDQYDQSRADAQPWTQAGVDALNAMRQRLGMGPLAAPVDLRQQAAQEQQRMQTDQQRADAIRAELLPQFTSGATRVWSPSTSSEDRGGMGGWVDAPGTVNEAALNAEVQRRLQAQQQAPSGTNGIVGEGSRQMLPGGTGSPQMATTANRDPYAGIPADVRANMPGGSNTVSGQAAAARNPTQQGFVAPRDRITNAQGALAGVGTRLNDIMADPNSGQALLDQDPGYAFRVQQGQQALERSAAARGGLLSGRALKDTADFGQGLASQEFGNAFARLGALDDRDYGRALTDANRSWDQNAMLDNRDYSRAWDLDQSGWNRLAAMAGMGQTSQQNTSALGANFSNAAASNAIGAGNAAAAGTIGQANAWNNAISQGVNQMNTNRLYDIYSQGRTPASAPAAAGGYGAGGGNYGIYGGDPYRN